MARSATSCGPRATRPFAAVTAALRVRLCSPDDEPLHAVLALKRRLCIEAGVSRFEEPLNPYVALTCADDPARLGGVNSTPL